jgi:hypothetical protein
MKEVKEVPAPIARSMSDPWIDALFDGKLRELDANDYARYKSVRSASSAIRQAAEKRGIDAVVAVRGDALYVQANTNGKAPAKPRAAKAPAKRAPAKRAAKAAG